MVYVVIYFIAFQDADVYLTEYIKVEAIIGPKLIQKFVIPVDIPYTEPTKRRKVSAAAKKTKLTHQSNIGKIKMRKISDLQKPVPLKMTPPFSTSWRGRAHVHDSYASPPARPIPSCFCHQCMGWNGYTHHHSVPCLQRPQYPYPYPGPPAPSCPRNTIENNFWRPFM